MAAAWPTRSGCTGKQIGAFGKFVDAMYRAFVALDCSIVEINPLVVTGAGEVVALDAKVSFDDNALYRHPDIERCATRPRKIRRNSRPPNTA